MEDEIGQKGGLLALFLNRTKFGMDYVIWVDDIHWGGGGGGGDPRLFLLWNINALHAARASHAKEQKTDFTINLV